MRKAGGLFPPTPFRARRAVSVTSVVQNAVLYIGIENAFWVNKSCRKAKDSFNGLKHKSALNRHAAVHWMDTTASIQLKFMRPLDGQTRYNPIETCVSMGWTQRPPPRAENLAPGIAAKGVFKKSGALAKPPAKLPYEPRNTLNTRKHTRNRLIPFRVFRVFHGFAITSSCYQISCSQLLNNCVQDLITSCLDSSFPPFNSPLILIFCDFLSFTSFLYVA